MRVAALLTKGCYGLMEGVWLTVAGPMMVTPFSPAILISSLVLFSGMPSAMIAIVLNCSTTTTNNNNKQQQDKEIRGDISSHTNSSEVKNVQDLHWCTEMYPYVCMYVEEGSTQW